MITLIVYDVIIKGTRVDGIYDSDPEKNPSAIKFDSITFEEIYDKKLNVMDMTAITLCKENKLPLCVFNMNKENNLLQICQGKKVGTEVNFS